MTFEDYFQPKRLAPLSLIHQFASRLPSLGLMIYFGFIKHSGEDLVYSIIALIIGVLTVPGVLLNYYYFTYWINDDELVIHSGVLSRKQRNIPLKRIQNVNIHENFLHRLLGLAKIQFETAGDVTAEGVLDSVKRKDAEEIKSIIKNYSSEAFEEYEFSTEKYLKEHLESSYTKKSKDDILIEMSVGDVAKYGMMRFRPLVFAIMAWFLGFGQQFFFRDFSNELETFIIDAESYFESLNYFYIGIGILVFLLLSSLISWLIDIALTINQYYGFTLSREGNKLYTKYGFLNKRSGTIPLKKLQMVVLFSNFIREKLGFWSLQLETAGASVKDAKGPEVAIPFAEKKRVFDLVNRLIKLKRDFDFKPVSRKTIRRSFIRSLIFYVPFSVGIYYLSDHFVTQILFIPVLYWFSYLRWKNRGYDLIDNKVIMKQGVIQKKIKLIPLEKIQTVSIVENFFQRRLGICTLNIDTAAGSGFVDANLVDLVSSEATELRDAIMEKFHNKKLY